MDDVFLFGGQSAPIFQRVNSLASFQELQLKSGWVTHSIHGCRFFFLPIHEWRISLLGKLVGKYLVGANHTQKLLPTPHARTIDYREKIYEKVIP